MTRTADVPARNVSFLRYMRHRQNQVAKLTQENGDMGGVGCLNSVIPLRESLLVVGLLPWG